MLMGILAFICFSFQLQIIQNSVSASYCDINFCKASVKIKNLEKPVHLPILDDSRIITSVKVDVRGHKHAITECNIVPTCARTVNDITPSHSITQPQSLSTPSIQAKHKTNPKPKIKHLHKLRCNISTRWHEDGYGLIELLHGMQQRGIQILVLKMPHAGVENPSEWEWAFCEKGVSMVRRRYAYKLYPIPGFGEKYKPELFFDGSLECGVLEYKDYYVTPDKRSRYVNIINHVRPAVGIPDTAIHTINIVGDSTAICVAAMDEDTVASFLQCHINEVQRLKKITATFSTVIHASVGNTFEIMRRLLLDIPVYEKDIIVITASGLRFRTEFGELCEQNGVPYYDSQPDFHRPHNDGELFVDFTHTNPNGNKKIAEILYNKLFVHPAKLTVHPIFCNVSGGTTVRGHVDSSLNSVPQVSPPAGLDELGINPEFLSFIRKLETFRNGTHDTATAGAVVMNCNPFTLGHLHLVEVAAAQVNHLYVFVVEEDQSEFPFADRLKLVQSGTTHIRNLVVLPSSPFVISSTTLPGYFLKGKDPNVQIDASTDLEIFCRWVVPTLNILTRFVGEEPLDRATQQYNKAMQRTLPKCGVSLQIIPRKELDGVPISASWVRALLLEGDFRTIADIVPLNTLTYLQQSDRTMLTVNSTSYS